MTPDVDDEVILFEEKPNVFLYALEATRIGFVVAPVAMFAGLLIIYSKGLHVSLASAMLLGLILCVVVNFCFFWAGVVKACFLTIIATNRRAVVRFSGWGMPATDGISIAIEAIGRVEINSYGATYGSVYLESSTVSYRKISENGEHIFPDQRAPQHISDKPRDVIVPIKKATSIWRSMPFAPGLYGFWGFRRFDEFANIVSERHKTISESDDRAVG